MLRSSEPSRANGVALGPESVFLVPPGSEFHVINAGPCDWMSIFVPDEAVESCGLPSQGEAHVLEAPMAASALWSLTARLIEAAGTESTSRANEHPSRRSKLCSSRI